MDGLRYYVGSLILFCATSIYAAQEYTKKGTPSLTVKMQTAVPSQQHKLYTSSRIFYVILNPTTPTTIAVVKEGFEKELTKLAQQKPTCDCGGPCADIRAAQAIIAYLNAHKDKKLQIAFLGAKADDTATLQSLGFNAKEDALYAQY